MGPPASYRVSRVRYYSGAACVYQNFAYGNFTLFVQLFQNCSAILPESRPAVLNPDNKLSVWPLSRSLAATWEIDVSFSSYGYLDVSVHHVPSLRLYIHLRISAHYCRWVPPFGDLRVSGYVLLTAAFRSLSRPSSAPSAKASTLCSY